jgi:hypothetical protein
LLDLWDKDKRQNNLNKYVAFAGKAHNPSLRSFVFRNVMSMIASNLGIPPDNDGIVPEVSARFRDSDYSQQPLRFQKTLDPPDHEAIHERPAIDELAIRTALLDFIDSPPPPPPSTFTLSVTKQGTGTGTVTSNLSGIDCGAVCQFGFTVGHQVVLSQVAGSGSTFAGWGGACTGIGPCIVTMTADQNVTAIFNLVAPPPPPPLGEITLSGRVTNSVSGAGIGGASLLVVQNTTNFSTVSLGDGSYSLNLPTSLRDQTPSISLQASAVQFVPKAIAVDLRAGNQTIHIALTPLGNDVIVVEVAPLVWTACSRS